MFYAGLIITGYLAGLSVRILGIGGGLIILPVLITYYHFGILFAVNIAQVFYIFICGTVFFLNLKKIHLKTVRYLILFTFLGILVGAYVANRVSGDFIKAILGIYLLYAIFRMIRSLKKDFKYSDGTNHSKWLYLLGIPAGFLTGSIGIASGSIFVPVLHFLFGFKMKEAVTNSVGIIFITAIIAFSYTFYLNSVVSGLYSLNQLWNVAFYIVLSGFAGLFTGAKINSIISVKAIKIMFISVLFFSFYKIVSSFI
ncbi:MAG: sulfite exporter TauE/SafE family protein [Spirochaetes bacterium]|nr:sulfite exporter TauE/SafE family protein [Spirochaetota bacterium]